MIRTAIVAVIAIVIDSGDIYWLFAVPPALGVWLYLILFLLYVSLGDNRPLIIIPVSNKVLGSLFFKELRTTYFISLLMGRNILGNDVYTLSCSDQYIHWYQGRERKLAWL